MRDKWMNIGFEEDELKPYNEPLPDLSDQLRIGKLVNCIFGNTTQLRLLSDLLCLAFTKMKEDEKSLYIHRQNPYIFLIFYVPYFLKFFNPNHK